MITVEDIKELGFKQYGKTKVGTYWNLTTFVLENYITSTSYYLSHYAHVSNIGKSKINLNEGKYPTYTQTLYHGFMPSVEDFKQLLNWLEIDYGK